MAYNIPSIHGRNKGFAPPTAGDQAVSMYGGLPEGNGPSSPPGAYAMTKRAYDAIGDAKALNNTSEEGKKTQRDMQDYNARTASIREKFNKTGELPANGSNARYPDSGL